eukprot:gene4039-4678_t
MSISRISSTLFRSSNSMLFNSSKVSALGVRSFYTKLTEDNFDTFVKEGNQTVIVDFYADWCGPCKMMDPIMKNYMASADGTVKIGKIDIDVQQDLAQDYNVSSIPLIVGFKNGKEVARSIGAMNSKKFEEFVTKTKSL